MITGGPSLAGAQATASVNLRSRQLKGWAILRRRSSSEYYWSLHGIFIRQTREAVRSQSDCPVGSCVVRCGRPR